MLVPHPCTYILIQLVVSVFGLFIYCRGVVFSWAFGGFFYSSFTQNLSWWCQLWCSPRLRWFHSATVVFNVVYCALVAVFTWQTCFVCVHLTVPPPSSTHQLMWLQPNFSLWGVGPLGVTLAAILDEEAENTAPHGGPIYCNYLIVVWTGGLDLTRFLRFPMAPHVQELGPGALARCVRRLGLTEPQSAVLLFADFIPLRKMLSNANCWEWQDLGYHQTGQHNPISPN